MITANLGLWLSFVGVLVAITSWAKGGLEPLDLRFGQWFHAGDYGFPLAFYFSAQGSLAIYVALIGIYALIMKKMDKEYGVDEGDLE